MDEQDQVQQEDVQSQDNPDEGTGPAVEPVVGDQGPQVAEDGESQGVTPGGFDPNRPVSQSAPPPEAQSGVPQIPDGSNEGVEAQPEYAGSVTPGEQSQPDGEREPDSEPTE